MQNRERQTMVRDAPDETHRRILVHAEDFIRIVRIPGFDGSPYDHGVLAHETFHLACGALQDLGVPHDDHEEAHAYFFEIVYRRFLEFLRGRKA